VENKNTIVASCWTYFTNTYVKVPAQSLTKIQETWRVGQSSVWWQHTFQWASHM